MFRLRRLLLPIDFSERATAVTPYVRNKIIERSNDGFEPCRASGHFTRPGGRFRVSKL